MTKLTISKPAKASGTCCALTTSGDLRRFSSKTIVLTLFLLCNFLLPISKLWNRKKLRDMSEMETGISDVSRVFLGRPVHTQNPQRCHDGWCRGIKLSKSVPPHVLKMQSLALFVLRFLCKKFSKLLQFCYITKHSSSWITFQKVIYSNKSFVWM